jgi:O-antigen/teichoic acid export membrane protein
MGTAFAVTIILARILEISEFGLMTLSTVVFAIGSVLTAGVFRDTLILRQNLEPEAVSALFWLNLATSLAIAMVLAAAAEPVARLLHAPDFTIIMWMTAGSIAANGIGAVPGGIRVVNKDFARIGLQSAALSIALAPVTVTLALLGFGAVSAVSSGLIYYCVMSALNWHSVNWRPMLPVSVRPAKVAARTGFVLLGQQGFDVASFQIDRGIIGGLLGPHQLGLYSVGRRLNDLIMEAVISPSLGVATPLIASIQDNIEKVRSAYLQTLSIAVMLAVPTNLGLLVVGDLIIVVLFGDRWLEAAPVLYAFALMGLFTTVNGVQRSVVQGGGRPDVWLRIQAVHTIANVIVIFAAAPYGITAIAYAIVARATLLSPLAFLAAGRITGTHAAEALKIMLIPVQAGIAMICVVALARTALPVGMAPILSLAILVTVGAATYLVVVGLFARAQLRQVLSLVAPKLF